MHSAYAPLDHGCSLFGRKFDGASAGPVLRLARDCDYGLGFDPSCVLDPPPVEPLHRRVAQFQKVRGSFCAVGHMCNHKFCGVHKMFLFCSPKKNEKTSALLAVVVACLGSSLYPCMVCPTVRTHTQEMLQFLRALTKQRESEAALQAARHADHNGPQSDGDGQDLDYWNEHAERLGVLHNASAHAR